MMSFTEVFLLLFGFTSFFLHYVTMNRVQELEKKVRNHEKELSQPIQIEVMDVQNYDERELW